MIKKCVIPLKFFMLRYSTFGKVHIVLSIIGNRYLKIAGQSGFKSGLSVNLVKTSIVKSQVLVMSTFMDF